MTGAAPSVSVVIPTRERPHVLPRAVKSVLEQEYDGQVECLVVFDQAPVTDVPLEAGPGRAVRTLANGRTPGLAGARNAGALEATGELLGFLDDDDEWLPDKLRRQVDCMRRTGAHAVGSGLYVCRGGRRIRRAAKGRLSYADLLRARHMEVNACTVLVDRERFLTDIGLVDERLPGSYAEDYEWLLRVARTGDIVSVPEPLVRIHWDDRSYFARDWPSIAAAQRYLLERYPDFGRDRRGLARITGQISFALAAAGRTAGARRWAFEALRLDPRQPRPYLAMLISLGVLRADTVLRMANALGRGV